MYGSYGVFKRMGLSTTSHIEPRMTKHEWMEAYGTGNNTTYRPPRRSRTAPAQRHRERNSTESTAQTGAQLAAIARAMGQEPPQPTSTTAVAVAPPTHTRARRRSETTNTADHTTAAARSTSAAPQVQQAEQAEQQDDQEQSQNSARVSNKRRKTSTESSPASDVRERTRQLLTSALITGMSGRTEDTTSLSSTDPAPVSRSDDHSSQYTPVAKGIEEQLFQHENCSTNTQYRQRTRSLCYNLSRHPALCRSLVDGSLLVAALTLLPDAALADPVVARARAAEQAEMNRDAIIVSTEGTQTNEYTCIECHSRNCEFWLVKEGRDTRKSEVWGGGGDDATTVILIRCQDCNTSFNKEI